MIRKIHSKYYEKYSFCDKKGFGVNYEQFLKRNDMKFLYKKYISKKTKISKLLDLKVARQILENNYSAKKWNFLCLAIWIEKNL